MHWTIHGRHNVHVDVVVAALADASHFLVLPLLVCFAAVQIAATAAAAADFDAVRRRRRPQ